MSSTDGPTVLVSGFIGLYEAGGVTWDYIQYPLGLLQLGSDVYYIEDTGLWPVFNSTDDSGSCERNEQRLRDIMTAFGMEDRWIYRDEVTGGLFGISESDLEDLLARADALINISCSLVMRPMYEQIPVRILVDSDPMFTQIQ